MFWKCICMLEIIIFSLPTVQMLFAVCLALLLLSISKAIHVQGTSLVVWCVAEIRAEISHIVQSEYHKCSVIPNDDHTCHHHHLELQCSALRFSARFYSSLLLESLCVQSPYLDWLCVLLINHLSAESSRSCIIALSDDGDAAYFACKISSQCLLIEWQWNRYGVTMQR